MLSHERRGGMNPEDLARQNIDELLEAAGWVICDADKANIFAAQGVAIRRGEFDHSEPH